MYNSRKKILIVIWAYFQPSEINMWLLNIVLPKWQWICVRTIQVQIITAVIKVWKLFIISFPLQQHNYHSKHISLVHYVSQYSKQICSGKNYTTTAQRIKVTIVNKCRFIKSITYEGDEELCWMLAIIQWQGCNYYKSSNSLVFR